MESLKDKGLDTEILSQVGFKEVCPQEYSPRDVALRDGTPAVVWIHQQTGHGILDPRFWEKADHFYEEEYRNEFGAEVGGKTDSAAHLDIYKDLNQKQFCAFAHFLDPETKYLEIGCSFGGIFNKVVDSGVRICHGIEPNKKDTAFVQANNKNAKVFNTTFEAADLARDYYDVVVAIEVLEHVISPGKFLEKVFSVLCLGGKVHIEVPNHNDVLLKAYKNTAYDKFYYHKAHIHYFTEQSLQLLFDSCGFEGKVSSFLMYPLFNHVWWYQNQKPQSSASVALVTPQPAEGTIPGGEQINNFYKKAAQEYEQLVNENMLGDCLIYQGKKK